MYYIRITNKQVTKTRKHRTRRLNKREYVTKTNKREGCYKRSNYKHENTERRIMYYTERKRNNYKNENSDQPISYCFKKERNNKNEYIYIYIYAYICFRKEESNKKKHRPPPPLCPLGSLAEYT